ncbi:MAG: hypothetical protein ACE37F_27990 [Nannocystaceae bacterium]|nr:hypothetical protein [bacterium]
MRWIPLALASTLAAPACSKPPQPQPAKAAEVKQDAEDAKAAEPATPKPPPLSEEDKRLIAADPKDLTPEMRRKRAYALRRKAMQNPNSPLARTLNDLQQAYEDGDIDPNAKKATPTFTVDGKPPRSGKGQGPLGVGHDTK